MSINNQKTEVTKYDTELWSIFGKRFSVIMETMKSKSTAILNINLSNWIWSRKYSQVKLSKTINWDFLLDWESFYNETKKIKQVISANWTDEEMDEVLYKLTENIQLHLLRKELDFIVWMLQEKWMKVAYTQKKNWPNLEFELFNVENPGRFVTIYLQEGDIMFDYFDPSMSKETKDLNLFFLDSDWYTTLQKWLSGALLVIQNKHKSENENE